MPILGDSYSCKEQNMTAAEMFEQWAHLLLEWVGFGTIVGLMAKAIMP